MTGEEFKKLRKAARMTQAQMAERLEVSRKTIVNWENDIFAIPEDALDTLTEKGVATAPEAPRPITLKSHPDLFSHAFKGIWQRNHKHPHWWIKSLWNFMTPAQQKHVDGMIATTTDLETMVWTPERAIVFTMTFVGKPRIEAEDICRNAGFDVPVRESAHTAYRRDLAKFRQDYPGEGWRWFEELYPQHKEQRAVREPTPEETAKAKEVQQALDNAFSFNSETKGT